MSVHLIPSAVDSNGVTALRDRALSTLTQIKNDYFPTLDDDEFHRRHLGHTSLTMKIAAYRFFDDEIFATLRAAVETQAMAIYGATDLKLHPIFYLRMSFPGIWRTEAERNAFLDSVPHYDRSYGVHAFSFWLTLEDADEASGGLASFTLPDIETHFATDGRNRYNQTGYQEMAVAIDPLLRRGTRTWPARAGDILTFDSTLLHGATKPVTRRRISLDFRLAPSQAIAAAAPEHQRIFDAFGENVALSNARNLAMLGDTVGAERIFNALGIASPPMRFSPRIVEPRAEMRWQDEYAYLREAVNG